MEAIDKILTTICRPIETVLFTPLYRMLTKKQPHEVSDDERKLMRLSQSTVLSMIPILIIGPTSLFANYRYYMQTKKLIGNPDKYRRFAARSVIALGAFTVIFSALYVLYPKSLELKVMQIRKNEVQQFQKAQQFSKVFKPTNTQIIKAQKPAAEVTLQTPTQVIKIQTSKTQKSN